MLDDVGWFVGEGAALDLLDESPVAFFLAGDDLIDDDGAGGGDGFLDGGTAGFGDDEVVSFEEAWHFFCPADDFCAFLGVVFVDDLEDGFAEFVVAAYGDGELPGVVFKEFFDDARGFGFAGVDDVEDFWDDVYLFG